MQRQENADMIRYEYYRKHILLPFIADSRLEFDGHPKEDLDIPDRLIAASWCGGDIK